MIDTHTHLYMEGFTPEEGRQAVDRAVKAGVSMMIFAGVSPASNDAMLALHADRPANTRFALGLHPTEVADDWSEILDDVERMIPIHKPIAIGETGIDLYWEQDKLELQKLAFERQVNLALDHGLPLIIHCREAVEPTLEVLKRVRDLRGELPKMVFHSFTSNIDDVKRIREVCDPYFGINGVLTFKNAQSLREALPEIGIERIVLETDAPYLAPVPHRGKRNESCNIPYIKDEVARVLDLGYEETEQITDENAAHLYNLS